MTWTLLALEAIQTGLICYLIFQKPPPKTAKDLMTPLHSPGFYKPPAKGKKTPKAHDDDWAYRKELEEQKRR